MPDFVSEYAGQAGAHQAGEVKVCRQAQQEGPVSGQGAQCKGQDGSSSHCRTVISQLPMSAEAFASVTYARTQGAALDFGN